MKCIKCDKCKNIVDSRYQGNTPPYYLFYTIRMSVGEELNTKDDYHFCKKCATKFINWLEDK